MSYVVPINILFNTDVMWDVMNATQWTPGLHPESSALHPHVTDTLIMKYLLLKIIFQIY